MSKNRLYGFLLSSTMLLLGCSSNPPGHVLGSQIGIRWGVIENTESGELCRTELTLTNKGDIPLGSEGWRLYFNFARIVAPESMSPSVQLTHINGDFFRLSPTREFLPLQPGESRKVRFDARGPVVNESSGPAGFYVVFWENGWDSRPQAIRDVQIEPFHGPQQTRRAAGDRVEVPTPGSRFRNNEQLRLLPANEITRIIPTPIRFVERPGQVGLAASFRIHYSGELQREADYLAEAMAAFVGSKLNVVPSSDPGARVIRLRIGSVSVAGTARQRGDEAYRLNVDPDHGIDIVGSAEAGVFYGIQSLRALVAPEALRGIQQVVWVPEVSIEDAPRFSYRGMHLDVARNFQPKDALKKLLDLMAFYKLNRFHFHLTDDEGWRLAIRGLPELTEVGGRRGHTLDESDRLVPSFGSGPDPSPEVSSGSGYYTREDFVEILRHARRRHIEVIPEIDVPGHARAAIQAMDARYRRLLAQGNEEEARRFLLRDPDDRSEYRSVQGWNDNVINVCQESTYRFLETLVDDIVEMYRQAGVPLRAIHTGGDEVPHGVWEKSPACQTLIQSGSSEVKTARDLSGYFLLRFHDILARRKLATAGWEEIALTGEGRATIPNPAFVGADFRVYVWNSIWGSGNEENAYQLANAGYQVILCNASNLYFDEAYEKDPKEVGQYWAGFVDLRQAWEFTPFHLYQVANQDSMGQPLDPTAYRDKVALTEKGRRNILGIQGQLWSENVKSAELLEYLAFPKLLGLAERAWADAPWTAIEDPAKRNASREMAWNRFANSLGQRELPRLDYLSGGLLYRIPPPGATVEEGKLKCNVAFPGLAIRYTTDGSEPTPSSPLFREPVGVKSVVKVKAFDTRGRSSRTVEIGDAKLDTIAGAKEST